VIVRIVLNRQRVRRKPARLTALGCLKILLEEVSWKHGAARRRPLELTWPVHVQSYRLMNLLCPWRLPGLSLKSSWMAGLMIDPQQGSLPAAVSWRGLLNLGWTAVTG
jgi:hypothetical protein